MYVQITTRCNMSCAHCGFACTAVGQDMSLETFRKAIQLDDSLTIGGGEPTIHPAFWQIIGESIASVDYVWLATNGKETQTALALAKLAKRGIIGCALSQDEYHDYIDPVVTQAFTKERRNGVTGYYEGNKNEDHRELRDVSAHAINSGRCDFGEDGCICEDLFCMPDGRIKACGCADSPILGTVDGFEVPEDWEYGVCHKLRILK